MHLSTISVLNAHLPTSLRHTLYGSLVWRPNQSEVMVLYSGLVRPSRIHSSCHHQMCFWRLPPKEKCNIKLCILHNSSGFSKQFPQQSAKTTPERKWLETDLRSLTCRSSDSINTHHITKRDFKISFYWISNWYVLNPCIIFRKRATCR